MHSDYGPPPKTRTLSITDSDGTVINLDLRKHEHYFKISAPIFLDLNADGFAFSSEAVNFDYDSDGELEKGAWLADNLDGILAIDYDGDGKVTHGREIAFAEWHEDAHTDLEGLQLYFDSNKDGVLDKHDELWHQFGVWVDANLDGINDEGEFRTLAEMGIESFTLSSDGIAQSHDGADIHGIGQFTYEDGSTGDFADATIYYTDGVSDEEESSEIDGNAFATNPITANAEESEGGKETAQASQELAQHQTQIQTQDQTQSDENNENSALSEASVSHIDNDNTIKKAEIPTNTKDDEAAVSSVYGTAYATAPADEDPALTKALQDEADDIALQLQKIRTLKERLASKALSQDSDYVAIPLSDNKDPSTSPEQDDHSL